MPCLFVARNSFPHQDTNSSISDGPFSAVSTPVFAIIKYSLERDLGLGIGFLDLLVEQRSQIYQFRILLVTSELKHFTNFREVTVASTFVGKVSFINAESIAFNRFNLCSLCESIRFVFVVTVFLLKVIKSSFNLCNAIFTSSNLFFQDVQLCLKLIVIFSCHTKFFDNINFKQRFNIGIK